MLILTRRVGESAVIDGHIVVTIAGIKGNKVRLGITAPKSVAVHREEFFLRMQRDSATADLHDGASPALEIQQITASPTPPSES